MWGVRNINVFDCGLRLAWQYYLLWLSLCYCITNYVALFFYLITHNKVEFLKLRNIHWGSNIKILFYGTRSIESPNVARSVDRCYITAYTVNLAKDSQNVMYDYRNLNLIWLPRFNYSRLGRDENNLAACSCYSDPRCLASDSTLIAFSDVLGHLCWFTVAPFGGRLNIGHVS